MCLIQGTSMALTLLCVVMLIGAPSQQHKLILLPQTESEREKGNSLENTSRFMMNIWKSPLTEQRRGRERKHASSNCVCWLGGFMMDRASRALVIIPLSRSRGFEDWPKHCHHRRSQQTYLSTVSNTPETSQGSTQRGSLTPHAAPWAPFQSVPHFHDHYNVLLLFVLQMWKIFKEVIYNSCLRRGRYLVIVSNDE